MQLSKLISVSTIAILAVGVAGCGSSETSADAGDGGTARVAMLSSEAEGSPWADLGWSAITTLEDERGIEVQRIAGVQSGAAEQQVRTAATSGFDPIVLMQDELGAAAIKLAPSFPDTNFIIADSILESDEPNVETVEINPVPAAYVAGVVAALTTSTEVIGFVGGADVPAIQAFKCGFEGGIDSVDSAVDLKVAYVGAWDDPTKGRDAAISLYDDGADIVMHAASLSGLGVFKAAQEKGKLAIGADVWQGDEAEGSVLWNALKDGKGAIESQVAAALDGDFTSGHVVYGPEQGAALYDDRDFEALDADQQATVKETVDGLNSGSVVPVC